MSVPMNGRRRKPPAVLARRVIALAVAAASGVSACFLGYNSNWGEAKRAQQRVAAESTPASIVADVADSPSRDAGVRVFRVRLRPDAQYLSQTIDVPKQVADLVDDANRVLVTTVALRLEVERIVPWTLSTDEDLDRSLQALQAEDVAGDVDLVVGLIGALPRQTDSLHEVGRAALLGKHLVVRATGRLNEDRSIDKAFYELSDDERARMLRVRKRHRALAVLLHEIGHCLGALHESDPHSLMNPSYDPKMSGFGPGGVALMRAALEGVDRVAMARAQLAILSAPGATQWVSAERNEEMARLRVLVDAGRGPGRATAAAGANEGARQVASAGDAAVASEGTPPELPGDARGRFARARWLLQSGAIVRAYEEAKGLFAAYPNVYAVQDLRCQLATVRWLERKDLLAECAAFARLSASDDAGKDGP
jgi:Matrixin